MNLKRVLGWMILVAGLAILVVSGYPYLRDRLGRAAGAIRPARNHNLLLVTLDTTRADHLGCYGGDQNITPNIDSLARNGVVFENTTATAPITLPSHASILTGLYPLHHGIRNNGMFSLPEQWETLADVLRDRGYATGAFVSAAVMTGRYGLDRGFDVYDDDLTQGRSTGGFSVPGRRGDITTAVAAEWLRSVPEDTPFFCWLHLYAPHVPYDPPPAFRRRFPGDAYTAEIAFADSPRHPRGDRSAAAHTGERGRRPRRGPRRARRAHPRHPAPSGHPSGTVDPCRSQHPRRRSHRITSQRRRRGPDPGGTARRPRAEPTPGGR
jgi:arylsulfatase A-like enzyme